MALTQSQHVLATTLRIWLANSWSTPMRCRRSGDTEEQSFTHSSNKRSRSPYKLVVPGSANKTKMWKSRPRLQGLRPVGSQLFTRTAS